MKKIPESIAASGLPLGGLVLAQEKNLRNFAGYLLVE